MQPHPLNTSNMPIMYRANLVYNETLRMVISFQLAIASIS